MQAFNDGSGNHLGRRVKIDYSQSAQGGTSKSGRSSNDGTRDIANSQTPVVLLRGLDPMSTLDLISDALRSSSGAAGQGAIGMKRIVLIRDRYTAMGIGLAFIEFIDEDASISTCLQGYHSDWPLSLF
jgi:RNA-binding protein 5/10